MATATHSKKINKAFVVGPGDLRYFYNEGKEYMQSSGSSGFKTEVVGVVKNIDAMLIGESADSVIGYSNPRHNEITGVAISMRSEDEEYAFKLVLENTAFDAPAHLSVGGRTLAEVEPCFRRLEAELRERTQWYSFMSNRVWLVRCRWVLMVVGVLLLGVGIASVFSRTYRLESARVQIKTALGKYEDTVSDANEGEIVEKAHEVLQAIERERSPVNVVKFVLVGILAFFIGKFAEKAIHYLFPRVVFEVGAGEKRHQTIRRVRKWIAYWMMSLIVGVVLLLISRKWAG